MTQTLYQILGLDPKAEDVVIKAAFKALAQKYHPDKSKGNQKEATELMARLNTAYQTLIDPKSRLKYDQKLAQLQKEVQGNQKSNYTGQHTQAHRYHHSKGQDESHFHHKTTSQKNRFDQVLIEKILSNQVDEIEMVNIFEKLYQTSLVIHHGFANTYSFVHEGQRYKHDFSSLKKVVLHKLQDENQVH